MRRGKRLVMAVVVFTLAAFAAGRAMTRPGIAKWKVVEIALPANGADEACLGRPIALALDADRIYIADAQDCAVKVFSKDGGFLRSVGRKGRGPGELSFPSGVFVIGGRLYVATPFAPDKVWALTGETLLVTSSPTGRTAAEKMLHLYDFGGRLLWEGLEARTSSDPVFDAFVNMILVCPGEGGDFFVVFRSGERSILHFTASGALAGKILVDERHAFQPLDMPFRGPKKRLLGFSWAAAWDRGFFYISAPAPVEGKDLGPGRLLSVVDREGRLTASVELPCPVHRFVVEGARVYAVDDDGGLRIFEVVR
jgi:hypothetical protein